MSDEIQAELQRVDEELAELRRTAREVRQRIGDRDDGPSDAVDIAANLTAVEEQEALISALETRREGLSRRLSGDSAV
jgi:hypothetical protein